MITMYTLYNKADIKHILYHDSLKQRLGQYAIT